MGERFNRDGVYVYLWLIHAGVWQKPTQHCKAIIFQLAINKYIFLKFPRSSWWTSDVQFENHLSSISSTRNILCFLWWSTCIRGYFLVVYLLSHVRLFCDPMDCSLPGSSVHGTFQARILEWVAIYFIPSGRFVACFLWQVNNNHEEG